MPNTFGQIINMTPDPIHTGPICLNNLNNLNTAPPAASQPKPRITEIEMQRRAYEHYQLEWLQENRISVQDFAFDIYRHILYTQESMPLASEDAIFDSYVYPFDSDFPTIWLPFDQFVETYYNDTEYMKARLNALDFMQYQAYQSLHVKQAESE